MERFFFGYSAKPNARRETLNKVAARARDLRQVESSVSWEDLCVDGRLIINEIEQKIAESTICIFDFTTINNNVLFELGLSVGQWKRVIIVRDAEDHEVEKDWTNFSLLTTVGWTGYKNADHLLQEINRISLERGQPLWDDLTRRLTTYVDDAKLLYFPSTIKDGASLKLSRLIQKYQKFDADVVDLEDYGSMPLEWYTEKI